MGPLRPIFKKVVRCVRFDYDFSPLQKDKTGHNKSLLGPMVTQIGYKQISMMGKDYNARKSHNCNSLRIRLVSPIEKSYNLQLPNEKSSKKWRIAIKAVDRSPMKNPFTNSMIRELVADCN